MITFLDPLIRKHVTHAMCTNATATCLDYKKKNWVAHINWLNGKKSEAVIRKCSVKMSFLKLLQNAQENTFKRASQA